MILHHYQLSPFSEKIRLMFGYAEIRWQSAISPAMPPRIIVDPLTGGYRRIPVAQIGADIFCDTQIISTEIAELTGIDALAKQNCSEEVQAFVTTVDTSVFMATVTTSSPAKTIGLLLKNMSPWQTIRFIKDRAVVSKTSSLKPVSQSQSLNIVDSHNQGLEQRLDGQQFLFGDTPTIADFSAYHVLWFGKLTRANGFLSTLPNVLKWMDRMAAMGHGQRTEISKSEVFNEARNNTPREVLPKMVNDPRIGGKVTIKPNDYAKDKVSGTLVGSDEFRWILLRECAKLGSLHVHFPKEGYELN
jgi:glutathione S-transferase